LDECATKYRGFCKKYRPQPKPEKKNHWGSKLLPAVMKAREKNKQAPGQMRLPWNTWEPPNAEIQAVAHQFIMANCYNPQVVAQFL
jgi:putative transposase